jgi:hypothetical protein
MHRDEYLGPAILASPWKTQGGSQTVKGIKDGWLLAGRGCGARRRLHYLLIGCGGGNALANKVRISMKSSQHSFNNLLRTHLSAPRTQRHFYWTSRGSRSCGVTTNLIQRLCRTMTASNHPTAHQTTENKAKVRLTKRVAMWREMARSERGGGGACVRPKSAKRMKKVTNDQPTIRQAGYGFRSVVLWAVGSGSSTKA